MILDESIRVSKEPTGLPGTNRLRYSVGVLLRQILTGVTIWRICRPVPTPDLTNLNESVFHDFVSANVILRSMYETYIMSHYILLARCFEQAGDVILLISRLHAKKEQIVLSENMGSTHPRVAEIRDELGQLKLDIRKHPEFSLLPERLRNYVTRIDEKTAKKWHSDKVETIAGYAGFHKTQHFQLYKYFSNYTHADLLSIDQVESVRSPNEAEELISASYSHAENFLSLTLDMYRVICEQENLKVTLSSLVIEVVDYWREWNSVDISTIDSSASTRCHKPS